MLRFSLTIFSVSFLWKAREKLHVQHKISNIILAKGELEHTPLAMSKQAKPTLNIGYVSKTFQIQKT